MLAPHRRKRGRQQIGFVWVEPVVELSEINKFSTYCILAYLSCYCVRLANETQSFVSGEWLWFPAVSQLSQSEWVAGLAWQAQVRQAGFIRSVEVARRLVCGVKHVRVPMPRYDDAPLPPLAHAQLPDTGCARRRRRLADNRSRRARPPLSPAHHSTRRTPNEFLFITHDRCCRWHGGRILWPYSA